jgi:hypothetical protein
MESSSDCTAGRMVKEGLIARCQLRGSYIGNFSGVYSIATEQVRLRHSRLAGQRRAPVLVRCYSNSGQRRVRSDCPLSANSGLMHCNRKKGRLAAASPNSILWLLLRRHEVIVRAQCASVIRVELARGQNDLKQRPVCAVR